MQINLMESDNPYSKAYHAIAELVWKACGGKEKTLTLTGTCGDVRLKAAPCHENGIEKIKLAALFQNSRLVYSDVLYRKDDLDAEEVALAIVPYCLHNSAKYNVTVAARYSLDNKTWGLREKDGKPVCVPDATVVCDPDLKTGATCDEKIASEIAGGVVAFIKKHEDDETEFLRTIAETVYSLCGSEWFTIKEARYGDNWEYHKADLADAIADRIRKHM